LAIPAVKGTTDAIQDPLLNEIAQQIERSEWLEVPWTKSDVVTAWKEFANGTLDFFGSISAGTRHWKSLQ
jgi:hypothetical protein